LARFIENVGAYIYCQR